MTRVERRTIIDRGLIAQQDLNEYRRRNMHPSIKDLQTLHQRVRDGWTASFGVYSGVFTPPSDM